MQYINIKKLKEKYDQGVNIIQYINQNYGSKNNTIDAIEISYDLQSGSYIDIFSKNEGFYNSFTDECLHFIQKYFSDARSILDAGAGELTLTSSLFSKLPKIENFFAFDLSWSRVFLGKSFYQDRVDASINEKTRLFSGNMTSLPFADNSIDIILTTHAIEPNHGREKEIITELLRVAKQGLVLCEPSFELSSDEQRNRMTEHGYIRDLPKTIKQCNATLSYNELMENYANPLNRTAIYIVKKEAQTSNDCSFADPESKMPLLHNTGYYFSPERGISYPEIEGIPIFRDSAQILTTALAKNT